MSMIGLLLVSSPFLVSDYYTEGLHFAKELQAKEMVSEADKANLKQKIATVKLANECVTVTHPKEQKTNQCSFMPVNTDPQTALYVFMSFSLPDETWMAISHEVEKTEGVLVLRGLPENSFKQLAVKIYNLRKIGVRATVQVDPRLFDKYRIDKVPTFVTTDNDRFDKVSGNVSLAFALGKMETEAAQRLRKHL